jgi:PAS domain-containing protein
MADASSALTPINLQLLFNAIPGSFIILDPDLCIRHVSNSFLELTATRRSELVGQPVLSVFSPKQADDACHVAHALLSVRDAQQALTLETLRYELPATGKEKYLNWELTPVPADNSLLAGILLQVSAGTRPEQGQPQERRNQELLQAIHQNLNDVVWDWDLLTNDIWWSNGFNASYGYTTGETERTPGCWYERIHPEDAPKVIAGIHQVIDSDLTLWTDVYRFKKQNGEYADVLNRGSIFRDPAGTAYRMIGSIVDVSLHKKTTPEWASEDLVLQP